ncbi:hypothetical protein ymoll0001_31990 [Yersinia mollaretii ATCC 43969]|uniref:Uncharacterized protein n=1 Tax=Yersinia mollaretii (strain ATCC 43969 / DSM 18520 / CIP 103324 / CNY 7263 / WAIP 204) TaxID=349967 RepID=A0ABP2E9P4_YERMW|nr:hypothetical protein ymoll0001_31990 [Yersinia mollaretii ATCC 43969]
MGELMFVETHYGMLPVAEIAVYLGRTVTAIRLAAQELGLCKVQADSWTEEEKEVIRTHYADGEGITFVGQLLPGRTRKTIFAMAKKMGVKSLRSWQENEVHILMRFYPKMGTKVVLKLPRRSVESIKIKASQLGLKYTKLKVRETPVQSWSDDEWHLLEKNLHLFPSEMTMLFPNRTKLAIEKAKERLRKGHNMRGKSKNTPS